MYGPRGATIPPKFIPKYDNISSQPNFRGPGRGRGRGGGSSRPRNNTNEEPTLPPRNWALWCETCDRDFPSTDLLDKHKSEHTTCGIDDCKFVGHPAVVDNHVKQQHDTGLYEKLKNVETPEDILKWRKERMKKYPTRANIELKQKAKEARIERGEKLDDSKNKFNKTNNPQKKQGNKKKRNRKNKQDKSGHHAKQQTTCTPQLESEYINQGVRKFKGTKGLFDEDVVQTKEVVEDTVVAENPLLKLIGMYGGSDESDEECTPDNSPVKQNPGTAEKLDTQERNAEIVDAIATDVVENPIQDEQPNSSSSATEINPNQSHSKKRKNALETNDSSQSHSREKMKKVQRSGLNYHSLTRTKPNTLLFKLLQSEIRHERNVLLQAVRFVVQNNFFDDKV